MTDKQDPIAHAARLLREAAEELRQAHTYHRSEGWQGETGAQSAYDVYMAAAQALEGWEAAVGAGGVQALSAAPAGWRELAAKVMDALADAQDTTNSQYPEHVRCYPSWERHARWLRWHADMFRSGNPVGNGAGNPDVLAALAASPTPPAEQQATKETSGGFHVWRDISTAPKDGSRFVAIGYNYGLYSEGRHICVAQWFRGCWMETSDWNEASELKHLTHWLPLPSPPDNAAELNDLDVSVSPQQDAPKAAQYEMDKEASNVRLDIDSNSTKPEQQRDVACSLEVGQHVGNGEHQKASCRGSKDSELLKIAARNLKYFIEHAQFSSFADKRAALNCLDALAAPQQEAQDSVSPRHPVVMQWRDNAIEACAKIADAYGHEHAAQDMRAMLTAPQQEAQAPVAWYEYNADLDAWFLAYRRNPKAKTRPLVFGDTAPQQAPAPLSDDVVKDAARWRWLSEHIGVAWNEGKFTSLVRIVSDKNRTALNASIDRMMAGDWSYAALAAQERQP